MFQKCSLPVLCLSGYWLLLCSLACLLPVRPLCHFVLAVPSHGGVFSLGAAGVLAAADWRTWSSSCPPPGQRRQPTRFERSPAAAAPALLDEA
eukprot:5685824-Pleurochrysis_carterae.AAC.7